MAFKHGVYVAEQATAVSTPATADVGVPFVVGTAPVHAAAKPAKANVPVLCTSWDEAVKKLGFSYDWGTYSLCEFMYSHFQLFGCQPVIFCNVLDAGKMKHVVEAKEYPMTDHKVFLPIDAIRESIVVSLPNGAPAGVQQSGSGGEKEEGSEQSGAFAAGGSAAGELSSDEDYSVFYDADACVVELLSTGAAYDAATLIIQYDAVTPEAVVLADVVEGLDAVDDCMSRTGVIPDLICAPGWSHNSAVAAVMATKAAGVMGLFQAKALIDVDCGEGGVKEYSELTSWKNLNNFVDENQILCWPMVKLGNYLFHMSTQLAGLIAQVDAGNRSVPYESPSNKKFKMDGCCLADGTEISLSFKQANLTNSYGVVTALNFISSGWVCWGNYTACFPGNADVKDCFIPVSRMFDYVGNTVIRTFWNKLGKPMTRLLADSILDTCNTWLGGLTGSGRLLGARAVMLAEENPAADMMSGIMKVHIYMTPPSPAQEIDFTLEYDIDYMTSAFA